MLDRQSGKLCVSVTSATQPICPAGGSSVELDVGSKYDRPNIPLLALISSSIWRYLGSKICNGRGTPGNRTTANGNNGSSVTLRTLSSASLISAEECAGDLSTKDGALWQK